MIKRFAAAVVLLAVSPVAAFFPQNIGSIVPATLAISSVQTPAGGGGGGSDVLMSTAYVSAKFSASGASLAMPFAMIPSTGSHIVVAIFWGQNSMTSVVDSRGNAYTEVASENRQSGAKVAIYHFTATCTYIGGYTVTATPPVATSLTAGVIVSSVATGATVSVDVTTNSRVTSASAPVYLGTTSVTSVQTGLCVAGMYDDSSVSDAITQVSPLRLLAEEQNGSSGIAGSTVWQSTMPVNTISGLAWGGNINLAAAKTWNTVSACFKAAVP